VQSVLHGLPCPPLPPNDLIEQHYLKYDFPCNIEPSKTDKISFLNGIYKFEHVQKTISVREREALRAMLRVKLGPFLATAYKKLVPFEAIPRWIVDDTSAGFCFQQAFGTTKGLVLLKTTILYLWHYFLSFLPILSSTLKIELRAFGKDARFFRPSDIASIVAAIHMFGYQNLSLCSAWVKSHICIGMVSPGPDFTLMWRMLRDFGGEYRSFDGVRWDANFPMWAVELICDFRKQFLPQEYSSIVDYYYASMYDGYTNCLGNLVHLTGNPSGHYNTSVDNSILELMNVWLYCYRNNIDEAQVLPFVCGDDLIIATRDFSFTTAGFKESANSAGLFLESIDSEATPFMNCVFCGTHPVQIGNRLLYTYDVDKQLSSLHYTTNKMTVSDYFSKLCSITANLYYSPVYNKLFDYVNVFYAKYLSVSSASLGLYRSVLAPVLEYTYSHYESDIERLH